MEKILIFASMLLLFSTFASICNGNFAVQPSEISIVMGDDFIHGNTSKKITLINNDNDDEINITWYVENPDPSMRRANRTNIANLSWIELEPEWFNIAPNGSADFYIHLGIPETAENINQSWEVWVTFKLTTTGLVNQESAIRVYIDTPKKIANASQESKPGKVLDKNIIISFLLLTLFILVILLLYKKKKS